MGRLGVIEQTFPYGHPDRRPAAPIDVQADRPDPSTMTIAQLSVELDDLEALRIQLDARHLVVLGDWDRRNGYADQGAVSASAALQYRHGRDGRDLRRDVTTARKLRRLPLMVAALGAGQVTAAHAEVLARALTEKTAPALERDEARLVRLARRLGVEDYRRAMRYWKAHADPDGTDPDTGLRNELYLSQSVDGDWFGKLHLDAESGSLVKAALDALLDEQHRAGDTTAGAGHDEPGSDKVPAPRRRADALVELARRGGAVTAAGDPHHRTRPSVIAAIDHQNLVDELGLGELIGTDTTLSATAIRRLACDADIIVAAFGTDDELLDLGRRARLVSPAQRLALVMRDQGCAFPGCDRPPGWCDAHHIVHWADGGHTDLDNLCLLCSHHHHLLHEGGWGLHRSTGGELTFTAPGGVTLPHPARPVGPPDPFAGMTHGDPPESEPRTPARGAPTADHDSQRPRPHQPRTDGGRTDDDGHRRAA